MFGYINELKEQNVILQAITQSYSCKVLINWKQVCDNLPENIYVFIPKGFIFILPNKTNLLRWKKVDSALWLYIKRIIERNYIMLNNAQQPWDHLNTHGITIPFYIRGVTTCQSLKTPDSNFILTSLVSKVLLNYLIHSYQILC